MKDFLHELASPEPAIGLIGGSGLYRLDGLEEVREIELTTPFGPPSDALVAGKLGGRRVFFLPRHGRGHRLLPHELNHRANIYALRSLNVRWLISVTAVGSLRQEMAPRDIVVPHQLFDHTSRRTEHTFFGEGIAAHISLAEPYCAPLRHLLVEAAREVASTAVHDRATYINMDGPAFSTRAESEIYRQWGCDIIGMTNAGECRLAREAEIAQATLALVTDYDCWKIEEEPVSVEAVVGNLLANAEAARKILARAIGAIPAEPAWPEHRALEHALITERTHWSAGTVERLRAIIGRFTE
jgi:5'-methylthioadenosine phosphorylase